VQKISSDFDKSKRDKLQQDIRRWLSPPDPWMNHNTAREIQHSGTGKWWIHSEAYSDWKRSHPSSLLWIHGKPGAGKTVLSSLMIQDIRILCAAGLASLAFFYCDSRENEKKDYRGLLSSLLVQLCYQSDVYYDSLSKFYLVHGNGSQNASNSELTHCLKLTLQLPVQATTYIVIDGLDEFPATTGFPTPREEVLELVNDLVGLRIHNLRICVTSRHETDIEVILGPLASSSFSLHGESGQTQDIAEYIKFVVHSDPKMRTWSNAEKELVIEVLTRKADGMFRWASHQLQHLRHCLRQRIRHALDELPEALDEIYDRTMEMVGHQH